VTRVVVEAAESVCGIVPVCVPIDKGVGADIYCAVTYVKLRAASKYFIQLPFRKISANSALSKSRKATKDLRFLKNPNFSKIFSKIQFKQVLKRIPGMRDTMYFKDDDYRLSLLQGNYVTLTNADEYDIQRIIDYNLPRVNISVHTTYLELRRMMLGNPKANDILEIIGRLTSGYEDDGETFGGCGIRMHTQIVLCPEINDGEALDKTLGDLGEFYPNVESVSVVPVGITKYREGLYPLRPYTSEEAMEIIEQVEKWQEDFLERHGTRLVFLGDEFYIKAGVELPSVEEYEEFYQLENGVGMVVDFLASEMPSQLLDERRQTAITGEGFASFLKEVVAKKTNVVAIKNEFFGEEITVAGLVTGGDIIKQLKGMDLGERLLVPEVMLKADTDLFLDDVTVGDLERELQIKVEVI
jgi:putative radical SAM enzyme (TIGR03279 family)